MNINSETTEAFPETIEAVWQAALRARENAFVPYSNFQVGAAVQLSDRPEIVVGCNVENASYGATMCAERSAIFSACSQFGKPAIEYIVVVTGEPEATVPCGLCLQVMAEFCHPSMMVYSGNQDGITGQWALRDLLPKPFTNFQV